MTPKTTRVPNPVRYLRLSPWRSFHTGSLLSLWAVFLLSSVLDLLQKYRELVQNQAENSPMHQSRFRWRFQISLSARRFYTGIARHAAGVLHLVLILNPRASLITKTFGKGFVSPERTALCLFDLPIVVSRTERILYDSKTVATTVSLTYTIRVSNYTTLT